MKTFNEENILYFKHTCQYCNKHFSRLKDHLLRKHNMTFEQYGDVFPNFNLALEEANLLMRKRIGEKSKNRFVSDETKAKVSKAAKSMHKRHRDENEEKYLSMQRTRAENARKAKGDNFKHSEETIIKMSGPRPHTQGIKKTKEHRKKLSEAAKSRSRLPHTEETKAKIKESHAKFKESDKYPAYLETLRKIGSRNENIKRLRDLNFKREKEKSQKSINTKLELEFIDFLKNNNLDYVQQFGLEYKGMWVYDFYIPSLDLLVETDGEYWHSKPEQVNKDIIKENLANSNNYNFVRISDKNKVWDIIFDTPENMKSHTHNIIANRIFNNNNKN